MSLEGKAGIKLTERNRRNEEIGGELSTSVWHARQKNLLIPSFSYLFS